MVIYLQMIDTPEERSKFEQLYIHYRGLMYYVSFKILNNEQDAEDAVHQAFFKVAENIKKVEEAISPKTKCYLVTIVENTSLNIKSYNARHQMVPYDDSMVGIHVEYNGSNQLASCLGKLNPRYREILTLKYHLGFDYKEIAKMMGISYANARKIEQRARDALMSSCKKEGLL